MASLSLPSEAQLPEPGHGPAVGSPAEPYIWFTLAQVLLGWLAQYVRFAYRRSSAATFRGRVGS